MTHPVRVLCATVPRPPSTHPSRGDGTCSLCRGTGPLIDAHRVVSDKFTDWDQYPTGRAVRWCTGCCWVYTDPSLRTRPWLVTAVEARPLDAGDLATLLSAPIPHDTALTVPISRHKHLIPRARYGVITTDDAHLPWGTLQVQLLTVVKRLRTLGFGEAALLQADPRWQQLSRLGAVDAAWTLDVWPQLEPWRQSHLYLQLALRGTRTKDHQHG